MKVTAENMVEKFLRTCMSPFTLEDFYDFVRKMGVKCDKEECEDFLLQNEDIFALNNGTYITRCGAFTGEYFSFRPSRKEIENKAFIVGHRCMPFADPEVLSCHYNFFYKQKLLPKTIVKYESREAADFFFLYGSEYVNQYIVSDPANIDVDLAETDYELQRFINITCTSLEPLLKDGFSYGDRIICNVSDWDTFSIEINFIKAEKKPMQMAPQDIQRETWYNFLESQLLESFEKMGPRKSIEEQLAIVFYNNRSELCTECCGSIEELFSRTKKIDFEPYGVESRIWYTGQEVPAFGTWNKNILLQSDQSEVESNLITKDNFVAAPDFVVDAFLKDIIHEGVEFSDSEMNSLLSKIYPDYNCIPASIRKLILLHLKNRHAILCSKYNRFAENDYAFVRHKAIELYSSVIEIVYAIDFIGSDISSYPQQPLVIFSQLYSHLMQIIKGIELEPETLPKDVSELTLSLSGMQDNFDYIYGDLKGIIEQQKKKGFVVSK